VTGKIGEAPDRPSGPISSWAVNPILHAERLAILFFQKLFESAPPGSFRFNREESSSELRITSNFPVNQEVLEKMPVIVVNVSAVGFQGLGMDQLLYEQMSTGARTHVDLCTGYLFVNCLAKERYESMMLAWFCAVHLWALRRILMKCGFHDVGQRIQVNPPSDPGQLVQGATWPEVINTNIATPMAFHYGVTVTEKMTHVLRSIELALTAAPDPSQRHTPMINMGGRGTGYVQAGGGAVEFPQGRKRPNTEPGADWEVEPMDTDPFTVTLVIGADQLESP